MSKIPKAWTSERLNHNPKHALPSSIARERRLLLATILLAGFVPAGAGLAGVLLGPALLAASSPDIATADSHVRYLSGLLLGIGLSAWSVLPRVETAGAIFRAITAVVFVGGLARLVSLAVAGSPSWPMLGGLAMEIGVTPALAIWQWRLSQKIIITERR